MLCSCSIWQLPEILSSCFLSLSFSLSVKLDIKHIMIFKKCSCVVEPTRGPCSVPYILFHETCFISACPPTVPLSSSSQSETSFIGDLIVAWNCILSCFINAARYRNCCILNHIYLFTTENVLHYQAIKMVLGASDVPTLYSANLLSLGHISYS
jgi:hypothetical protein